MTVTYTLDFDNVPSDVVRLCVGDTDINSALLQDEEINYFISLHQTGATPTTKELNLACIDAAYSIMAKLETAIEEEQTGQVRVRMRDRMKFLIAIIDNLSQKVNTFIVARPFLGGSSYTRRESNAADLDRVVPEVSIGQFDNPDALDANEV